MHFYEISCSEIQEHKPYKVLYNCTPTAPYLIDTMAFFFEKSCQLLITGLVLSGG